MYVIKEGIRVALHNANQMPLISEQGYDLRPGTKTNLALEVTETHRQPHPYESNCTSDWIQTEFGDDETVRASGTAYTTVQCGRLCLLRRIRDRCGCLISSFDDLNWRDYRIAQSMSPNESYCSKEERECIQRNLQESSFDREQCGCQLSCSETMFDVKMSASVWPSDVGWFFIAQKYDLKYE